MAKRIILTINDNGDLMDDNGGIVMGGFESMNFVYQDADDKQAIDIAKLVSLGVTPDDLIKLKANKII